jgi:hypothetical protein
MGQFPYEYDNDRLASADQWLVKVNLKSLFGCDIDFSERGSAASDEDGP